jgi:predicted transcriptional regulator
MKKIVKLKESDLNRLVKRVMKEGMFDKKTDPLKELEQDVKRAMFQKVAAPETTGVQGVWDHKEREKSMEEILDDLQDVIDHYRNM